MVTFFYVMISSFVYYYVPIYTDSKGFGSNVACLLIMVNSVCGIYLSSTTTRIFTKRFGKASVYISSVLALLALILFALLPEFNILVVSLLLLGFSTSFGTAARMTFFSRLKSAKEFGMDRATGIYDLVERAGEAVGPLLFASLFAGNFLIGILEFAGISLVAAGIYYMLDRGRTE